MSSRRVNQVDTKQTTTPIPFAIGNRLGNFRLQDPWRHSQDGGLIPSIPVTKGHYSGKFSEISKSIKPSYYMRDAELEKAAGLRYRVAPISECELQYFCGTTIRNKIFNPPMYILKKRILFFFLLY